VLFRRLLVAGRGDDDLAGSDQRVEPELEVERSVVRAEVRAQA